MATRREFIGNGIAAALLAGMGYTPRAAARGSGAVPLYKAIFDERFHDSVFFAEEIASLGVPVHAIRGDITALWFDDLDLRWRREPAAVAGLTTEAALFCLERLAWDHRLRVVFRAEHALKSSDCIEHTVACAGETLEQVRDLEKINTGWWAPVAHIVAGAPGRLPDSMHRLQTPVSGADAADFLVSWVIAPVRPALRTASLRDRSST